MKKYTLYILILIILVGLLSPIVQVNAADGTCRIKYKDNPRIFTSTVSRESCFQNARFQPESLDWTPLGGTTPETIPVGSDPVGYCTGGTTTKTLNITQSVCINFHKGTWSTTPPSTPTNLSPAPTTTSKNSSYQLLTPLPCDSSKDVPGCVGGKLENFDTTKGIGNYLNLMIQIFIGLCAVLSVVMIVIGGLEYMTSELVHSKEAGKEKIVAAILGLLIALGAYALLNTINPDLLKSDLTIPNATTQGSCSIAPITTEAVCKSSGGTWTVKTFEGNGTTIGGGNGVFKGGGGSFGGTGASGSW